MMAQIFRTIAKKLPVLEAMFRAIVRLPIIVSKIEISYEFCHPHGWTRQSIQ